MEQTQKVKVKSTTIYRYPSTLPKDLELESERRNGYKSHYVEYGDKGEISLDVKYDDGNLILEKHEFKYDDQGNKIEEVNYFENELAEKIRYEYEKGLIIKETILYPDGEMTVFEFRYDGQNNIIEKTEKDSGGTVEGIEKFTYSGKQLAEKAKYNSDQQLVEHHTFKYNDSGELEEEMEWRVDDNRKLRTVYQGNKKSGKKLAVTYDEKGKVIAKIKEIYDEKQRLIELSSDSFSSNDVHKYVYDDRNNVLEVEIYRHGSISFKSSAVYEANDLSKYYTVLVGDTGYYTDVFNHEF